MVQVLAALAGAQKPARRAFAADGPKNQALSNPCADHQL
jgi:hypothetical protein